MKPETPGSAGPSKNREPQPGPVAPQGPLGQAGRHPAPHLPLAPGPVPLPGLWHPWQRFVAAWVRGRRPAPASPSRLPAQPDAAGRTPALAPAEGLYRPLCLSRGCFHNRDGTCTFDRVEPAPLAVMDAGTCPHALFLTPGPP